MHDDVGKFYFAMEDLDLNKGFLRDLVIGEIAHYHPDIKSIWAAQEAKAAAELIAATQDADQLPVDQTLLTSPLAAAATEQTVN